MKYKLTDNTKVHNGTTLYQIEALQDFSVIKKGQLGGFIQSEKNLSQEGECWVFNTAIVRDNARVSEDAWVDGHAKVSDNALVTDNAGVTNNAEVSGNAKVSGEALVGGHDKVKNMKDKPKFFGSAEIGDKAWITWVFIPFMIMLVSAIVFGFMVLERFDSMLLSMSGSYY